MERKDGEKTTFALLSEVQDHLHNPADLLTLSELAEPSTFFVAVTELTGYLWAYMGLKWLIWTRLIWNTFWNSLFCGRVWLVAPHQDLNLSIIPSTVRSILSRQLEGQQASQWRSCFCWETVAFFRWEIRNGCFGRPLRMPALVSFSSLALNVWPFMSLIVAYKVTVCSSSYSKLNLLFFPTRSW